MIGKNRYAFGMFALVAFVLSCVWGVNARGEADEVSLSIEDKRARGFKALEFSADDKVLYAVPAGAFGFPAAEYPDDTCYVIDIESHAVRKIQAPKGRTFWAIAVSPDQEFLAALSYRIPKNRFDDSSQIAIIVISLKENRPHRVIVTDYKRVFGLRFSNSGNSLHCTHELGVDLWDLSTDKLTPAINARGLVCEASFSRDGSLVALGTAREIGIFSVEKSRTIKTLQHGGTYSINSLAISADNRSVTGLFYRTTESNTSWSTWNIRSGQSFEKREVELPVDARYCQFLPHGDGVAAHYDDSVSAWSVVTGKRLFRFPASDWHDFAISPSGHFLAMGDNQDGITLHILKKE